MQCQTRVLTVPTISKCKGGQFRTSILHIVELGASGADGQTTTYIYMWFIMGGKKNERKNPELIQVRCPPLINRCDTRGERAIGAGGTRVSLMPAPTLELVVRPLAKRSALGSELGGSHRSPRRIDMYLDMHNG